MTSFLLQMTSWMIGFMFQIWEFLINRIKGLILYILVIKIIENIQFEADFFYI